MSEQTDNQNPKQLGLLAPLFFRPGPAVAGVIEAELAAEAARARLDADCEADPNAADHLPRWTAP